MLSIPHKIFLSTVQYFTLKKLNLLSFIILPGPANTG